MDNTCDALSHAAGLVLGLRLHVITEQLLLRSPLQSGTCIGPWGPQAEHASGKLSESCRAGHACCFDHVQPRHWSCSCKSCASRSLNRSASLRLSFHMFVAGLLPADQAQFYSAVQRTLALSSEACESSAFLDVSSS